MAVKSMGSSSASPRYGATVIEAIVVALIVVGVAVIVGPRLSRGSAIEAHPAELESNLAMLRNAIRLYVSEHRGAFPDVAHFEAQMTERSNLAGETSAVGSGEFVYGPYLRELVPMPMAGEEAARDVVNANRFSVGEEAGGWLYSESDGSIRANLADHVTDRRGKAFNAY